MAGIDGERYSLLHGRLASDGERQQASSKFIKKSGHPKTAEVIFEREESPGREVLRGVQGQRVTGGGQIPGWTKQKDGHADVSRSFLQRVIFLIVHVCICVWVCTHVCGSPWRPESLVSQELELQVSSGSQAGSSAGAASAPRTESGLCPALLMI